MSIASVNCLVLTLTEEKSILETQRIFIDSRRQTLATQGSTLYTEYTDMLAKRYMDEEDGETNENDRIDEFNWDEFKAQYEAAQDQLDKQDQAMERERTQITTKIDVITTELEGAQKILTKNIETELKGLGE